MSAAVDQNHVSLIATSETWTPNAILHRLGLRFNLVEAVLGHVQRADDAADA